MIVTHKEQKNTTTVSSTQEIDVGDRNIEELAKDCAILARTRRHCGAPSIFRVVLIGPRGSGSRTVARHLCQRFHLVHGKLFLLC